jgi:hypothetical protein
MSRCDAALERRGGACADGGACPAPVRTRSSDARALRLRGQCGSRAAHQGAEARHRRGRRRGRQQSRGGAAAGRLLLLIWRLRGIFACTLARAARRARVHPHRVARLWADKRASGSPAPLFRGRHEVSSRSVRGAAREERERGAAQGSDARRACGRADTGRVPLHAPRGSAQTARLPGPSLRQAVLLAARCRRPAVQARASQRPPSASRRLPPAALRLAPDAAAARLARSHRCASRSTLGLASPRLALRQRSAYHSDPLLLHLHTPPDLPPALLLHHPRSLSSTHAARAASHSHPLAAHSLASL